jgi:hypothetical protein
MVDSAAKNVSASALHMEDSAAAIVKAGSVDVTDGAIGVAIASSVKLRESTGLVTVAKSIEAEDTRTLMMFAARVNGQVESVFTPLTALAAGAGFAVGLVVMARTLTWLVTSPIRRLRREAGDA